MFWPIFPLAAGFLLDLLLGDPCGFPHPVVWMGKLIRFLEKGLRKVFSGTAVGETAAGALLWFLVTAAATTLPAVLLFLCRRVSPWLALAAESLMCWQILAVRSLRTESMAVYDALSRGDLKQARYALSRIVGRDTSRLNASGIIRGAVETVSENTSDGVVAPLLWMAVGGAPLGFFYKAVNTMDSMLGYTDPPYTYMGRVPAKADDGANFFPSRVCALLMLAAGMLLGMNGANGWKIFCRDRFCHASPNSAQTESVCAGLLGLRLGGDARYHGILHKKPHIGDSVRQISREDIPKACCLLYLTAFLALLLSCAIRLIILIYI